METKDLAALARKAAKTSSPDDYKAWSDAYDALHPLTPEELNKVGGAISRYPGFEQ
jgi:hypothetical protein